MINQIVKTHRRHFFAVQASPRILYPQMFTAKKKQNGRTLADTPVVFFLE